MSIMAELTFFIGIKLKQTKQGTFVHQVKYTNVHDANFVGCVIDRKSTSGTYHFLGSSLK
jgi:hypothetical protein